MHPKYIATEDYTYILPEDKIAHFPLENRDASRLLIYKDNTISPTNYSQLATFLPQESLLIFNNTKVVEARLLFQKPTGGIIEVFCLEPADIYPEVATAMTQQGMVLWKCLIGGASKWKHGQVMKKEIVASDGSTIMLEASITERLSDCFVVKFSWQPASLSFAEMLHLFGIIPIPPYLKRNTELLDAERYQTVYAQHNGSVAAPTAGLHFTPHIFEELAKKNIQPGYVTLHVGAGTFRPVKSALVGDHEMHAEYFEVSRATIQLLAGYTKPVIAVGTTSLRTLESLYQMGRKLVVNPSLTMAELEVAQWEAYDDTKATDVSKTAALNALLKWMDANHLENLVAKTQILIAPGYDIKMVDALITNFHQPNSTLLLLVAAFVGDDWKRIYQYALENDFRFLSYGDGSLLWKQ